MGTKRVFEGVVKNGEVFFDAGKSPGGVDAWFIASIQPDGTKDGDRLRVTIEREPFGQPSILECLERLAYVVEEIDKASF